MIDLSMEKMKIIWRWIRQKPLDAFLLLIGVSLFGVLILVMFSECIECWAIGILGTKDKRDTIQFIGWGIAGVVAIFGAVAVSRRADAQVQIAKAQVETVRTQADNNELIERGHIQERYKAAVEHLGCRNESVRIGSFYEFFRLANDNKDLRRNIFDILRAHLRRVTTSPNYRVRVIKNKRTTEEVQCLLDVLFRSTNRQGEFIFAGLESTTLREIFLVQANLYRANLQDIKLQDMDLRYANLQKANLRGVDLQNLALKNARLQGMDFHSADVRQVYLDKADLHKVDLRKADLYKADLRKANLREAKNLETANLSKAKIKDAKFPDGYKPPADADTTSDD